MRLNKNLQYSAEAKWDHQTGGTAIINGFTQEFDTPHEYGGNESAPCPDQLFMVSLAGCIINTYNYYREMLEVDTRELKVRVSSDIELTEYSGYRITGIEIDIEVWSDEDNFEMNQTCAERARKYCHITKSIEPAIPIKSSIKVHLE